MNSRSFKIVQMSDDSLKSSLPFNGTFNSYWNNCKTKKRHITGNTDIVCQKTATWTGIRKYNIDADYQITTLPATVGSIYSPNNNNIGCQGDIGERKAKSESAEVECMSRDCFHMSHCFCFCTAPVLSDLDQSNRCDVTCSPSSFEDGECGGQDHFSAYEECKK
uniref:Uncharacterized protein n=1 Tax=Magallana gigas TaxID=29159 RepID=K1RS45_MAGGI